MSPRASQLDHPLTPGLEDELVRTLSDDGFVSLRVLISTNLAREAVHRHQTSPVASVALARALSGGLLLATEGQSGERVQISVRGDGPLGTITVTADSEGEVRGYVQHAQAQAPLLGESLGISKAVGFGLLSVERMHASWKQPYAGVVPIVAGEIAEDLARYLLESEQKPSAVALGVYLGQGSEIEAAAGYLVQAMPGAPDDVLADFEQRVAHTSNASELVRAGASADELLGQLLGELGHGDVERVEPRFRCHCTSERVRQAATLLGRDELREMADSGETLEVRCAFCAAVYQLSAEEVASVLPDA